MDRVTHSHAPIKLGTVPYLVITTAILFVAFFVWAITNPTDFENELWALAVGMFIWIAALRFVDGDDTYSFPIWIGSAVLALVYWGKSAFSLFLR